MTLPYQGTEEANVGIALQSLHVDFLPQYSLDGGNTVRGGQIVDYVVFVPPEAIALYCQGAYWHGKRTSMDDLAKQAAARQHGFVVFEIWEDDYKTVEDARRWLQRNIL